ncbi:MAG: hypothetical protein M3285_07700 [Actinomycetota bacterium]|nr:hypothetical protein [Actinomycetota bacterium]
MRKSLVVLITVLSAGVAMADTASVEDPVGDSGTSLDIVEVSHSHRGNLLRHDVTMAEVWTNEEFRSISARIWLPDGDPAEDRNLYIGLNEDGSFRGNLYGRRLRGFANVYRVDDRTIRFELSPKLLSDVPIERYSYRVAAMGSFECPPDVVCAPPPPDLAPDRGRIRHKL